MQFATQSCYFLSFTMIISTCMITRINICFRFQSSESFKKPRSSSTRSKRKGCRCGNATAIPGKLTCCGQRCPCYVESKPCVECRCRGCRNPHMADGLKVMNRYDNVHTHLFLSFCTCTHSLVKIYTWFHKYLLYFFI